MDSCKCKGNGWRLETGGVFEVRKHQEGKYLTALADTSGRGGARERKIKTEWVKF